MYIAMTRLLNTALLLHNQRHQHNATQLPIWSHPLKVINTVLAAHGPTPTERTLLHTARDMILAFQSAMETDPVTGRKYFDGIEADEVLSRLDACEQLADELAARAGPDWTVIFTMRGEDPRREEENPRWLKN